jgi:hypothetical protein
MLNRAALVAAALLCLASGAARAEDNTKLCHKLGRSTLSYVFQRVGSGPSVGHIRSIDPFLNEEAQAVLHNGSGRPINSEVKSIVIFSYDDDSAAVFAFDKDKCTISGEIASATKVKEAIKKTKDEETSY